MVRRVTEYLSERITPGKSSGDRVQFWSFAIHVAVLVYVSLGWLISWRIGLYFYMLLLPMIPLQWLLNGGCSIVNNIENLLRLGRWHDPKNHFEGAFISRLLRVIGVKKMAEAQITTVLCSLMLIFWVCAICRMVLVVPGT